MERYAWKARILPGKLGEYIWRYDVTVIASDKM
jgi:hypothetical protein